MTFFAPILAILMVWLFIAIITWVLFYLPNHGATEARHLTISRPADALSWIAAISLSIIGIAVLWGAYQNIRQSGVDVFVSSVLSDLVADFIAWIFVAGLILTIALQQASRRHRDLCDFFGLSNTTPTVSVFVSALNIKPGGARMINGEEWPGYSGVAISAREFTVLRDIDLLFQSPLLEKVPKAIREHPVFSWLRLTPIHRDFAPSPLAESDLPSGTVILLGSRLVNIGSRYYQDNDLTIIKIDLDHHEMLVARGGRHGTRISAEGKEIEVGSEQAGKLVRTDHDLAVLERLYDNERGRTVFILAGTGSNGTMAATLFLAQHWRELLKSYGKSNDGGFALVFRCPNRRLSATGYKNPELITELRL